MRLLFDENRSPRLVRRLMAAYPESAHVRGLRLRGQPDRALWDSAGRHDFALVSKDTDFRELGFLHGAPPKVIWLAVGNAGTEAVARLLES